MSDRHLGTVDEFNEDLIGSFFLQETFSAFGLTQNIIIMRHMEKAYHLSTGAESHLIEFLFSRLAAGYPDNFAFAASGSMGDRNYHKNHLFISVIINICRSKCAELL